MSEGGTETQRLTHEAPALGRDGEPCAQCGSPLAADQRYCLNCGERRGGSRVDYRQRMQTASADAEPVAPGSAAPGALSSSGLVTSSAEPEKPVKGERDYAPLAAVGGIAVLGLMLLVGVLIGRGDNDAPTAAPAPVVVPGVAATGASAGDAGNSGDRDGAAGLGGGNSGGGKQKNAKGKSETAAEAGAVTASESQLEELESETGEDAAKNALKLPDKIATPGAPPPIDKSKPPAGGEGGGVVIK